MANTVTAMIHVSDVRATVEWYEAIGFTATETSEDEGQMTWALMTFGKGQFMLNRGGRPSERDRRDVDLYVTVDSVDEAYRRLEGRVEIREELHDTFYGMREFVIRDINGFWVTFGQVIG
jgi:uncharacterized glyoxalase superfamily protein PhnB